MKVCYNTHGDNPQKHPFMPSGYPWTQYEVEDDYPCPAGFVELPLDEYLALKASFDLSAYLAAISPSPTELAKAKISAARDFGHDLIEDFAVGNMLLGIVPAGKTEAVTMYLHKLNHFVENGSLYAAVEEIDAIMARGVDSSLAPFVTDARLIEFKAKIQTYLNG